MAEPTDSMKRYSGKEFTARLRERGASEIMQEILDFIKSPPDEAIDEAIERGADGVRRRHFVRATYQDTNEALFVELDIVYFQTKAKILKVVEYETEAQYNLYRGLASRETPGTFQSN